MSNNADIFLKFGFSEKALYVKSIICFEKSISKFRFSLSTLLVINSIMADSEIDWKIIREWQPRWRHKSNEIEITSQTPINKIIIEYHGNISGWCNIIDEKRIALSSYSAWTISETSEPVTFSFKLENKEDYFVINGRYDSSKKLWLYGDNEHDEGYIIALKNGYFHVAKTSNFSFYYLNEAERIYADYYTHYFDEIIKYYTSIFPQKEINIMDIVSLGMENGGGAYFRKELVVIEKLHVIENINDIRRSTISLLAHELGHNWFAGANTTSWEDWLNETGAEWAALLFILSLPDIELFEQQIDWPIKKYKETPLIETPDLSRPDGVHWRGTIMFYEIYKTYGKDVIKTILQTLASLSIMTTENFLNELALKMDNEIPKLIEKGLTLVDYSGLFAV